jgi:hypothetical protein
MLAVRKILTHLNQLKLSKLAGSTFELNKAQYCVFLTFLIFFARTVGCANDLLELWQFSAKKVETESGGASFSSHSVGASVSLRRLYFSVLRMVVAIPVGNVYSGSRC